MSINNYATLVTAIENRMARTDLTAEIPNWIREVEDILMTDQEFRIRQMEESTTGTITSNLMALPTGWLGFKDIYIVGNPNYTIRAIPLQEMRIRDQGGSGQPYGYAVQGDNIEFFPSASDNTTVGFTYYKRIPALSEGQTSNWLLANFSHVYLKGCLWLANDYIFNEDRAQKFQNQFREAVNMLKNTKEDDWSTATPRVIVA